MTTYCAPRALVRRQLAPMRIILLLLLLLAIGVLAAGGPVILSVPSRGPAPTLELGVRTAPTEPAPSISDTVTDDGIPVDGRRGWGQQVGGA